MTHSLILFKAPLDLEMSFSSTIARMQLANSPLKSLVLVSARSAGTQPLVIKRAMDSWKIDLPLFSGP